MGRLFTRQMVLVSLLSFAILFAALADTTGITKAATATIWSTASPTVASANDTKSVEVGVKFRTTVAGTVTGIRFYKGTGNTGTHTGTLWSKAGVKLATATFSGETATGWQTASFTIPVSITANTTYVASYHAPKGHYAADVNYFAAAGVTNGPLTALKNGTDGVNGVYKYSSSVVFPSTGSSSTNYWVDPVFSYADTTPDTTPPTISSVTPTANATSVAVASNVTATFSEALDATTATSAMELKDSANNVVVGATTYDATSKTITFNPTSDLANSASYTATIKTTVKDVAGNALTTAYSWSFTTAAVTTPPATTSQSIWMPTVPTVSTATDDTASVELGIKFTSSVSGKITGLAFYKSYNDAAQHTLTLWSAAGASLGTAKTSGETTTGWQTATFASPIAIAANTTYTASYRATMGRYSFTQSGLTTSFANGSLNVIASGGVYTYGSGAPTLTYNATNYWVDVVFVADSTTTPDTTPPTISSVTPTANATSVAVASNVTATFSEALDATTATSAMELKDSANNVVVGATTYDATSKTITFNPTSDLANSASYTATIKTTVKDVAGNALTTAYSWSFTTAAVTPVGTDLSQGPGGPILVLTSSSNQFSKYYAEILRTEGLNSFASADIGSISASLLSQYSVIILGDEAVTDAQVSLLTDWVNAGGNLIAMHPDKKLATLLGITDQSSTLSDSYLLIDTSSAPGQGIVDQTIQYHGSADRYALAAGTRAIATLYSSDTTATASPAVTMRSVGSNGGQVSAFTYDLARSIVYTHQGNPLWAGQERDGSSPIRPNDLFYGAKTGDVQPDYVNLNKVAIPQADEQQRLLTNTIEYMNQDRNPLPKFWYFPNGKKAVLVMAGDDHDTANGTQSTFDYMIANSPAGCSNANWECLRATSWMYTNTPLTNAQAASYYAQGFDIGAHVTTGCADWTPTSLNEAFLNDLTAFRAKYTSLPNQTGSRTHCIAWSDYATTPIVELKYGIRMDLNYYYWPGSWVQNRPGFFTGSGLSMRFANTDGSMIDVYQTPSHLVNESGQDFPTAINLQLDRALGPEGYYGALGTHYDYSDSFDRQLVQAALSHNIPAVSAQMMLDWNDGRNASSFGTATWSGSTLNFTATANAKVGSMLRGMLPVSSSKGTLTSITKNGVAVSYTTETIKGILYAIYPVTTGSYAAVYSADTTAPTISTKTPANAATSVNPSANITATFSEPLDASTVTTSTIELRDGSSNLVPAAVTYNSASNTVTLDPTATLAANTTYTATIHGGSTDPRVKDSAGNALAADATWSFTTGAVQMTLWSPAIQTVSTATDDTAKVELGVQFKSDVSGKITGISFYKSANVASQHTVTLWDASGVALGTATTTSETASGWQTASFASPIAITANTTYTASYSAPTGQYSYTASALGSGYSNGVLHVLSNGGVYNYNAGMPTSSYNATNYWVDVVFAP